MDEQKVSIVKEDVGAINAQINQCYNQCFTICMAALTIFGVMLGWTVQNKNGVNSFQTGIWLFFILGFLLWTLDRIARRITIMSAYLRIVVQSQWEKDIDMFLNPTPKVASLKTKRIRLGQEYIFYKFFIYFSILSIVSFLGLGMKESVFSIDYARYHIIYLLYIFFVLSIICSKAVYNKHIEEKWELFLTYKEDPLKLKEMFEKPAKSVFKEILALFKK